MTIIDKEILISAGTKMDKYYEDKGYKVPRVFVNSKLSVPRGSKILVKIEDIPKGSGILVKFVCDFCNGVNQIKEEDKYKRYYKFVDGEKDCCSNSVCMNKKAVKSRKQNVPVERSVGEKYPHLIKEWSSKNLKSPYEHLFGSEEVVWWHCDECNTEYDMMIKNKTKQKCGCPYCRGMRVNDTNSLWATHPHIANLLVNPERGHQVTYGRNTKEKFKCPDCGFEEKKIVQSVVERGGFSCPICSDGYSYPEKLTFNIFQQAGIKTERQKVFEWSKCVISKNRKLNGLKRYDFFLPDLNWIVEVHGEQHYYETTRPMKKTFLVEQQNDKLKEELANKNGILNYVIIDCSNTDLFNLKLNLTNSPLNQIINFDLISWEECHFNALSSMVKTACELWEELQDLKKVGNVLNVDQSTVRSYLTRGSNIGLSSYNGQEEAKKTRASNLVKINEIRRVKVVQLTKQGELIKVWSSAADAHKALNINNIPTVCQGRQLTAGGYMWMYEDEYKNGHMKSCKKKTNAKKIIKLSLDGEFLEEYSSIQSAKEQMKLGTAGVIDACKGKRDDYIGFKWMYKEDYDKLMENNSILV